MDIRQGKLSSTIYASAPIAEPSCRSRFVSVVSETVLMILRLSSFSQHDSDKPCPRVTGNMV